jgi:hypothetical protein
MANRRKNPGRRTSKQPRRSAPKCEEPPAEHLNALLDEALQETFPASDPIAISIERCPPRPADVEAASKPRRAAADPAKEQRHEARPGRAVNACATNTS